MPTAISGLPVASALAGTEDVPVVQGGVTKRSNPAAFGALLGLTALATATVGTGLTLSSGVLAATGGGGSYYNDTAEAHGAVGNGTTDDKAALQAGIDALTSTSGDIKVLELKDGKTYRCKSPLTMKTGVFLYCKGVATIHAANADAVVNLSAASPAARNFGGIGIRYVNEYVNGTTPSDVVTAAAGCTDMWWERCEFAGSLSETPTRPGIFLNRGIRLDDQQIRRVRISGCTFRDVKYGFIIDVNSGDVTAVSQTYGLSDFTLVNNIFKNIAADAIELNAPGLSDADGPIVRGFTITNNLIDVPTGIASDTVTLDAGAFGIGMAEVGDVVFANNKVRARGQTVHIEDDCRRITIANNLLAHQTTFEGANARNIVHVIDGEDIIIAHNQVRGGGLGTAEYGINVVYTAGMLTRRILVQGNNISGHGGIGMFGGAEGATGFVSHRYLDNTVFGGDRGFKLSGDGLGYEVAGNHFIDCTGDAGQLGTDCMGVQWGRNTLSKCGGAITNQGGTTYGQHVGGLTVHKEAVNTVAVSAEFLATAQPMMRTGKKFKATLFVEIAKVGTGDRYTGYVDVAFNGSTTTPTFGDEQLNGAIMLRPVISDASGYLTIQVKTASAQTATFSIVATMVSGYSFL